MKKIAIFTEGQTEQIFIRKTLMLIFDNSKISFECLKLYKDNLQDVPYKYGNPRAKIFFLIVNIGNDEKVISFIKEREAYFFSKGYSQIIAIRDMYCEIYERHSRKKVDVSTIKLLSNEARKQIAIMSQPDNINVHFSIMEIEAWILGMYNIFSKLNPEMTLESIEDKHGFNLRDIDPQEKFYRPSLELLNICRTYGFDYDKSDDCTETLTALMERSDLDSISERNRCRSFKKLYKNLLSVAPPRALS